MKAFNKDKVLFIDNSKYETGASKASMSYFQNNPHIIFFCFWNSKTLSQKTYPKNVPLSKYRLFIEVGKNPVKLLLYFPFLLVNVLSIMKCITKNKIEIVHINDMYNMVGVLLKIVFSNKIKLIYHVRLLPSSYIGATMYKIFKKMVLATADKIICVSSAVKSNWSIERASIFYDVPCLKETLPKKTNSNSAQLPVRLLYLGNYIQGKGQDIAMNLLLRLEGKIAFTAHFYGEVVDKAFYAKILKLSKKNEAIRVQKKTSDIERVIKDADITLNFSASESFSMVCYESIFYGTPVYGYNSGGVSDIVKNGINGYLSDDMTTATDENTLIHFIQEIQSRQLKSVTIPASLTSKNNLYYF